MLIFNLKNFKLIENSGGCCLISVVIPLFNKAPHIANALHKVLAQTVAPLEIIVVDDGSTDIGAAVVQSFSKQGVRLLQQVNQGVSTARNIGTANACGSYVAFLDADDEWLPNHIEQLTRLIARFPDAALLSTAHQIRRDGHLYEPSSAYPRGWSGVVDDFFVAYSVGLSLVNSSTACVRKEALQMLGGFPIGVQRGEDVMAWVNLALRYPVAHTNVVTVIFNQEAVNRSEHHHQSDPPGSLVFMQHLLAKNLIERRHRRSLGVLFDRISVMSAAGCGLKGDVIAAHAIANLAFKAGRYKAAFMISLVNKLPAGVLSWARKFWHRTA